MKSPSPLLERIAWFEGAALRRRDLDSSILHDSRMTGLHVAAVHRTWGVALGLAPVLSNDGRDVALSPGVAYTCRGDPLVVPGLIRIRGPIATSPQATALAFDLILGPPRPSDAEACERLVTCGGDPAVEHASVRWELAGAATVVPPPRLSAAVRLGDDVPLGRFVRQPNGSLTGPDTRERRVARGLVRPHVAGGTVRGSEITWGVGSVSGATIDTASGGFSTQPLYFAWLVGGTPWPAGLIGPFIRVANPSATSFRIEAHFAHRPDVFLPPIGLLVPKLNDATVVWIGVEPTGGCPPSVRLFHFVALGLSEAQVTANWSAALSALGASQP
jgi:hypothetical protein